MVAILLRVSAAEYVHILNVDFWVKHGFFEILFLSFFFLKGFDVFKLII